MVSRFIHITFRLLAVVALAVISVGCEVISEGDRLIAIPLPVDTTDRTHVLIEYTGFRCVNCPKAAQAAEELHQTYGDRLIIVAMHPASNPFTQGVARYDYTCDEADEYYKYMGGSATTPFPTGNIDFVQSDHGYMSDYTDWATLLAAAMAAPTQVYLSVQATANAAADSLIIRTTYSADALSECRLVTWIVEDSVQGAQAMPEGGADTHYIHRHILRRAIGDPWGKAVTARPFPDELVNTAPLQAEAELRHYSVVAVLMDENKQIINAKQTTIQ